MGKNIKDIAFSVICWNCVRDKHDLENRKNYSNVNHNYRPIIKNNMMIGIQVEFTCFECRNTEKKQLFYGDSDVFKPISKKDFYNKVGIKPKINN